MKVPKPEEAIELRPDYDAMAYLNLLYRRKAGRGQRRSARRAAQAGRRSGRPSQGVKQKRRFAAAQALPHKSGLHNSSFQEGAPVGAPSFCLTV